MTMPRIALAALLACGTGCTSLLDPAPLEPLADAGGFCRATADAQAQQEGRCRDDLPALVAARATRGYQACDVVAAAVAAGRRAYQADRAEACLARVRAASCDEAPLDAAACQDAVSGAVPPGGACLVNEDCARPGLCSYLDAGCPGTCLLLGEEGEPCNTRGYPTCRAGLSCHRQDFQCVQAPFEGGSCAMVDCHPTTFCDPDTSACRAFLSVGQDCTSLGSPACTDGLYCRTTTTPPTCQPRPTLGQACPEGVCAAGLLCDAETCRLEPDGPAADGERCGFPFGSCGYQSFCDTALATPACAPRRESGPCTSHEQCRLPGLCDGLGPTSSVGQCARYRDLGAACVNGLDQCRGGATCLSSTGFAGGPGFCTGRPGLGGVCGLLPGEQVGCLEGFCDTGGTSATGTCRARLPLGADCIAGDDCQSGVCGGIGGRSACVPAPLCPAFN